MAVRISRETARRMGLQVQASTEPRPRGMNRLESRFAAELAAWKATGQIEWWGYEVLKLRLAKGAWYKPDFLVQFKQGFVLYETKGFMREAANVRIKVAAETYRFFKFIVVRLVKGQWHYTEIEP